MSTRILFGGAVALIGVAVVASLDWTQEAAPPSSNSDELPVAGPASPRFEIDISAVEPQVTAFCGDCHASPLPSTFPKDAWYAEVEQGYRFYHDSGRTDLKPPPMNQVVAFYRAQAPEQLPAVDPPPSTPSPVQFRPAALPPPEGHRAWMVSHLQWSNGQSEIIQRTTIDQFAPYQLQFCDMVTGDVGVIDPLGPSVVSRTPLDNPAHVEPVDLDSDGFRDLLVADLGSRNPADHVDGRVVWLREFGEDEPAVIEISAGIGRVADVELADLDGDRDLDVIVGEFGWRTTGSLFWLEQITDARADEAAPGSLDPSFERHPIDKRHGTIHVDAVDLNGDDAVDFIALISQEHEAIVAFLNDGGGRFEPQMIYSANEPSYGSSGIELADLDGDGDTDVVYSNGDTLDSHIIKPYHGVRWLENRGEFPFVHHPLTPLTGASRAITGDLDGDGDLDIACAAYLPPRLISQLPDGTYETLIWLEQVAQGEFVRHSLERSELGHLALCAGDFDGDGDVDLASGECGGASWMTIWWNEGRRGD